MATSKNTGPASDDTEPVVPPAADASPETDDTTPDDTTPDDTTDAEPEAAEYPFTMGDFLS